MIKQCFLMLTMGCWVCLPAFAADEKADGTPHEILAKIIPGVAPDSVGDAPIGGFLEVVFGPHVVYVSQDGRYMIRGDVIDMDTRENLTNTKRQQARLKAVDELGEKNMIVFNAEDPKHTVTVFTDIDCGYCRKLHREMDDYNESGITIRYLAFPRAGIPSGSYDKSVSVWCSDDRRQAMTAAKAGRPVPNKDCENPVKDHYMMGRSLGINGTPTMVLENGEVFPGYVPAGRLLRALGTGG